MIFFSYCPISANVCGVFGGVPEQGRAWRLPVFPRFSQEVRFTTLSRRQTFTTLDSLCVTAVLQSRKQKAPTLISCLANLADSPARFECSSPPRPFGTCVCGSMLTNQFEGMTHEFHFMMDFFCFCLVSSQIQTKIRAGFVEEPCRK